MPRALKDVIDRDLDGVEGLPYVEACGRQGWSAAPTARHAGDRGDVGRSDEGARIRHWGIQIREKLKMWHLTAMLSFEAEMSAHFAMMRGPGAPVRGRLRS